MARIVSQRRFTSVGQAVLSGILPDGYIRVINYHGTPACFAENFEAHLKLYSRWFVPASELDLRRLLGGERIGRRPRLLLTFDDGLASNASVAAPLLEKYGYSGWFFLPTDFIDCAQAEQREFARTHRIRIHELENEERVAMSWAEVRELAARHVIGAHTCSHARFHHGMPAERLRRETADSKRLLEARTGRPVVAFAWVGGETEVYTSAAQDEISAAGYDFSFLTVSRPVTARTHPLMLGRTNVDVSWPLERVRLQLSGWTDMYYVPKHWRVLRQIRRNRNHSHHRSIFR